jgi:arylsulfatase
LWFYEAGKYKGLPIDDRTAAEILAVQRPQPSAPRQRYIYYPDCAGVPEPVSANIRGRSYNIAAEVDLQSDKPEGVLFAQGGRFGGHTLYVKDGKLNYVYNYLGEKEQKLNSTTNLPTGKCVLGVRFRKETLDEKGAVGLAALYINNEKVAETKIQTQPGIFMLTGAPLFVGKDTGQPASSDYESPFTFTGGTIKQVTIDVSGEPYRDLDKEMQAMMTRD